MLVGLEQEPLDAFTWQKEQLPARKFNKLCPRGLVLLEIKSKISECRDRQISWSNSLLNGALQDTEIPQGRQEALCDASDSRLRPLAACLSCIHPFLECALELVHVDVGDALSLQRKQNLGHGVM